MAAIGQKWRLSARCLHIHVHSVFYTINIILSCLNLIYFNRQILTMERMFKGNFFNKSLFYTPFLSLPLWYHNVWTYTFQHSVISQCMDLHISTLCDITMYGPTHFNTLWYQNVWTYTFQHSVISQCMDLHISTQVCIVMWELVKIWQYLRRLEVANIQ